MVPRRGLMRAVAEMSVGCFGKTRTPCYQSPRLNNVPVFHAP